MNFLPSSAAPLRPDPFAPASPLYEEEPRRYFRCPRLLATLSVTQCRINRAKLSAHEALLLPYEPLPGELQPPACQGCSLSLAVESKRVPLFTAEEVLAGKALATKGGVPAPAAKYPVGGTQGSGASAAGTPGNGVPGKGVPGKGVPGKGVPGNGAPPIGSPGNGVGGARAPGR